MDPAYKNHDICYKIEIIENDAIISFNDKDEYHHVYFINRRNFIPFEKTVKAFIEALRLYNPELFQFFNNKLINSIATNLLNQWKWHENKDFRATGRSTRLIDKAIQELFVNGKSFVADHYKTEFNVVDICINKKLKRRILARLKQEHGLEPNKVEEKGNGFIIYLKRN